MADSVDEVMREEEVAKLDDDIVVVSEIIFKNFLMSSESSFFACESCGQYQVHLEVSGNHSERK